MDQAATARAGLHVHVFAERLDQEEATASLAVRSGRGDGIRTRVEARALVDHVDRAAVLGHVEAYLRARPRVTRRDPRLAAAVVVQAVEGLTHKLVVHGEEDADVERYVEEMVALVTAYLAAPP